METLKVNVNVVQLFFNVKDKRGALIPNLTRNDFEVLEDGKPQTIKYFTAESNLPLTLGMLIDTSGSQQRVLEMEPSHSCADGRPHERNSRAMPVGARLGIGW